MSGQAALSLPRAEDRQQVFWVFPIFWSPVLYSIYDAYAALHHQPNLAKSSDLPGRIALDGDQVGEHPWFDRTASCRCSDFAATEVAERSACTGVMP
jgi:hypothetical protein